MVAARRPSAERRFLEDWVGEAHADTCHDALCRHYAELQGVLGEGVEVGSFGGFEWGHITVLASGDIAETVLMPGDPYRARWAAETFLKDARLVNEVRGMLGFTGTYRGGDGATLQVQRFEGSWTDFPVSATVSGGIYNTYIITSRTGESRFRVTDKALERSSNPVKVTIR